MTKGSSSYYRVYFPKFSGVNRVVDEATMKVLSFRTLPDGWHYGRGTAPKFETEIRALELIASFGEQNAEAIEAFPEVSGGILVSAYHENATVDALTMPDNTVDWDSNEDGSDFEKLTFGGAIRKIRGLNWQTKSSDYCTHVTTVLKRNTSSPWHFETPQTAVGHQLFARSASRSLGTEFAPILRNSTQPSEGIHLSSGNLMRRVSQAL